jgi:hypothetical protein
LFNKLLSNIFDLHKSPEEYYPLFGVSFVLIVPREKLYTQSPKGMPERGFLQKNF